MTRRLRAASWKLGPDWPLLTGDPAAVARLVERLDVRYRLSRRDTLASGETTCSTSHTD